MLRIEDRGFILDSRTQPEERRIAFFTSLCRLQSGALLCGFQTGPEKHAVNGTIGLTRSLDGGQTWVLQPSSFRTCIDGIPGELAAAELIECSQGRLLLFSTWFDRSDPHRPLFDPVSQGILKSRMLMAESADEGVTWSDWRQISVGTLRGCALTGPCLRWENGIIAVPFESFREYGDPPDVQHAAWMMLSDDGGRTFSAPLLTAQHPEHDVYYWDQRLCVGRNTGDWTALFWTHDLKQRRDRRVHLRHGTVNRTDGGFHAEPDVITETTLPGQIAAPLRLSDGRILAFVVDRHRPGTMTLWQSHDEGRSWPDELRLVVYIHDEAAQVSQGPEDIDFCRYWEDMAKWSFGHPAVLMLGNDTVLTAWYAGTPDCMSLHWARVRTSEAEA